MPEDDRGLPPGFDPDIHDSIDLPVEFYLKDRSDPVYALVEIHVTKDVIEHEQGKDALMELATTHIMTKLNSRNELWVVLQSKNGTRQVIVLDELQSLSILPPDISTDRYHAEM